MRKTVCRMPEFELHRPREGFRRNHYLSVLLTLVVSVSAPGARGQATQENLPQTARGAIRGVVTALQQQEQSPLAGIQVELKGAGGDSQPVATITDSGGGYEFTKLPHDTYTVRVNKQGVKPFARSILLGANETSVLDVALTLETVVEKVEVQEQTTPVSPETSSPASTVNNAQLETLPLAQQKFREALPLVPGV